MILLLVAAVGCAGARPAGPAPGPMASVRWLVGEWVSESGVGERWREDGERLVGEGFVREGGAERRTERLEIVVRDGVLHYVAEPADQARTEFRATAVGDGTLVVENPAHDFPTRIEYRRTGDALEARVSGNGRGFVLSLRRASTSRSESAIGALPPGS